MITKELVKQYARSCDLNRVCGPLDTLMDDEWESLHRFALLAAAHGAAQRDAELLAEVGHPNRYEYLYCDGCWRIEYTWNGSKPKASRPLYTDTQLAAARLQGERINQGLLTLLRRYRTETPLGHQPHMIAEQADAAIAAAEKERA